MAYPQQIGLRSLLLLVAFLSVCFAFLAPYLRPKYSSLTGHVTVNGIPLDTARITLVTAKISGQSEGESAETNEDGSYRFSRFLKPGDYIARVEYRGSDLPIEIPAKYNKSSRLEFNLHAGDNRYDIDLHLPTVRQGKYSTEPSVAR